MQKRRRFVQSVSLQDRLAAFAKEARKKARRLPPGPETNLRKKRQLEGIAKAKKAKVYKGRPASIDAAKVREMKAQGIGPPEIAKRLGIDRASVYMALA